MSLAPASPYIGRRRSPLRKTGPCRRKRTAGKRKGSPRWEKLPCRRLSKEAVLRVFEKNLLNCRNAQAGTIWGRDSSFNCGESERKIQNVKFVGNEPNEGARAVHHRKIKGWQFPPARMARSHRDPCGGVRAKGTAKR